MLALACIETSEPKWRFLSFSCQIGKTWDLVFSARDPPPFLPPFPRGRVPRNLTGEVDRFGLLLCWGFKRTSSILCATISECYPAGWTSREIRSARRSSATFLPFAHQKEDDILTACYKWHVQLARPYRVGQSYFTTPSLYSTR